MTMRSRGVGFLKNYHYRGNVRELRNILLRAMLFRNNAAILRDNLIAAANSVPESHPKLPETAEENTVERVLEKLESGKSNFWVEVHRPFKNKEMTRDTVKTIISVAKTRYHANLPGLAVKLKVCGKEFDSIPEEKQKFISFKNFLYKTVRFTEN